MYRDTRERITALIQYIEKKIVQVDSLRKAGKTCGKPSKTKKNATFFAFVLEKQGGDVLY